MLAWARERLRNNPSVFDDFHYHRWMTKVGGDGIVDCVKRADEDQLDDLYILREELRLGI